MFLTGGDEGYVKVLPGIRRKTLCFGAATLMSEFRLRAGLPLPAHDHPQEQTGDPSSRRLRLTIGDETRELAPGDSWSISWRAPRRESAGGRRGDRGLLTGARGLPARCVREASSARRHRGGAAVRARGRQPPRRRPGPDGDILGLHEDGPVGCLSASAIQARRTRPPGAGERPPRVEYGRGGAYETGAVLRRFQHLGLGPRRRRASLRVAASLAGRAPV